MSYITGAILNTERRILEFTQEQSENPECSEIFKLAQDEDQLYPREEYVTLHTFCKAIKSNTRYLLEALYWNFLHYVPITYLLIN